MQYRRFGRTELQMPVFSCGGMRYQYKWQDMAPGDIPAESQRNLVATIEAALGAGINHIETARGYGSSEMQLGQILPHLDREQLIVQTKVAPSPNPSEFRDNFAKSLHYLQLDYVDLLALHGVNNEELLQQCLRSGGCLEVAKALQAEGKVRFLGFSTHAPLEVILQAIQTDQFDYLNLHWYYINQRNEAAIAAARQYDMGVFIISPSDKGGKLYQPSAKWIDLCHPLSPMVFNDLFCLSHPGVHTLSIGASRPEDFGEHLQTLSYLDKAAELLPPILERFDQAGIAALGADWWQTWSIGLPDYRQIPGEINILVILWLRNLVLAYDMVDYARIRYNFLGNAGHWFPGQSAANLEQYDLSVCLAQSPHAEIIPKLLAETHQLLSGQPQQRLSQQD